MTVGCDAFVREGSFLRPPGDGTPPSFFGWKLYSVHTLTHLCPTPAASCVLCAVLLVAGSQTPQIPMFWLHLSQHAQQTMYGRPRTQIKKCLFQLLQKNISYINVQLWWHLGLLSCPCSIVSNENTKFWIPWFKWSYKDPDIQMWALNSTTFPLF